MKKKYNFREIEPQMQTIWSEEALYSFDETSEKPLYSIDTPPPTVSGSLHIGHIFSYTQAEIIARFRRMTGYNVFYPFGFDDNGLPTERLVEKSLGIRAADLSRTEFIQKCLETTQSYEAEFMSLWQSLGFSCDWSLAYQTIGSKAQKISQASFIELYHKGKAYAKTAPVLWCTECQTSVAQAEINTETHDSLFHTIHFETDHPDFLTLEIATTRPELLNGCIALFIHPEDKRAEALKGHHAIVPLFEYPIPILLEETVEKEKGTGIVMCATYGDLTDTQWQEKHQLPYRDAITSDGKIAMTTPFIGGLTIRKARKAIIELLNDAGKLSKSEPLTHTIGTHERCGTPIEYLPSKQWYIDILTDKERYLKAADEINWYPETMKGRYLHWVTNLKWDWCISRQRFFGVPIPIWYCKSCGATHAADEQALPVNPLETNPSKPCHCGCNDFIPETAVLDTWATSSMTPFINTKQLPMSMHTQAHEIIRTWAFYSIVKSIYHTGEIPWKDLMICGFVLAKKGEKISKSKSNTSLEPFELIQSESADALRYWVASAKLGTDTFFDRDDLGSAKRTLNKLYNAANFCLMHLEANEDLNNRTDLSDLLPQDNWLLIKLENTMLEAKGALDQYEIGLARHHIDRFFWSDFCDDYLELAKERIYQPEKHGKKEQASALKTIYHALLGILKLYAPYIPHMTESIYQSYFIRYEKEKSIHILQWDSVETSWFKPLDFETSMFELEFDNTSTSISNPEQIAKAKENFLEFGDQIKQAISEARRYKSENNLSQKSEMPLLTIIGTAPYKHWFEASLNDLYACTHALKIELL
ncbi:MAG: valine--tRNA ligase [Clostridiales bacterium 38-18]|nr:MAG: valine--tRNA ligase [Clostridiales bacterium 38-18]